MQSLRILVRNTIVTSDRLSGAGIKANAARDQNRKPTMIRIPQDILTRIDAAAKRLGISRSAFIVMATAEKLERDD
jgi:hypothetical protein